MTIKYAFYTYMFKITVAVRDLVTVYFSGDSTLFHQRKYDSNKNDVENHFLYSHNCSVCCCCFFFFFPLNLSLHAVIETITTCGLMKIY